MMHTAAPPHTVAQLPSCTSPAISALPTRAQDRAKHTACNPHVLEPPPPTATTSNTTMRPPPATTSTAPFAYSKLRGGARHKAGQRKRTAGKHLARRAAAHTLPMQLDQRLQDPAVCIPHTHSHTHTHTSLYCFKHTNTHTHTRTHKPRLPMHARGRARARAAMHTCHRGALSPATPLQPRPVPLTTCDCDKMQPVCCVRG